MTPKAILTTFLIWLASTIIFAGIGVVTLDWHLWQGLARRGVKVEGVVIAKETDNHRCIRYSYAVGGVTYSGLGNAGGGSPEFEQLNIGDRVRVFYDPEHPHESMLGNPHGQADSITTGVLFVTIMGPLFFMLGLYRKGWLPISQ